MSRWFLMPDVDAIIERLEATVVRADTVTGEKWSGDMVRWSDAEAAVLAAVDARTAEIVKLVEGYDAYSPTGIMVRNDIAAEVARRFPNGGTNDGE